MNIFTVAAKIYVIARRQSMPVMEENFMRVPTPGQTTKGRPGKVVTLSATKGSERQLRATMLIRMGAENNS